MLRSVWLLNILVTILCIWLGAVLVDSIARDPLAGVRQQANTGEIQQSPKVAPAPSAALQLTSRHRPVTEFDSIVRGGLFHNPAAEAQAKAAVVVVPLPVLRGTILVGDEAKAILRERDREDVYGIGERVGGGTLVKIEADRVVIDLGSRRAEVALKSALRWVQPPVAAAVQSGETSASKNVSIPQAQDQRRPPEAQAQQQATRRVERLRRAQKIFELQQQMLETER